VSEVITYFGEDDGDSIAVDWFPDPVDPGVVISVLENFGQTRPTEVMVCATVRLSSAAALRIAAEIIERLGPAEGGGACVLNDLTVVGLIEKAELAGAGEQVRAAIRAWYIEHPAATVAEAARAMPNDVGWIAYFSSDLTAEQRFALAMETAPEWRGLVARDAHDLTAEQRVALARESSPGWRGMVAYKAPGLTAHERFMLAHESTPEWRGLVAEWALDLSDEERASLMAEGGAA
jgi:hypothetical protein